MSDGLHGIAVYNPSLLSREELSRCFIARKPLLVRLVEELRSEREGLPQHHLLVGRRGMGKTTMLRRLALAIEDDAELDALWLPLVFPEEQYNVASLSDFWLNCVDALADSLEARGLRDSLEAIDERVGKIAEFVDETSRRSKALELLLHVAGERQRRLVLLVDNLDIVFERLGEGDWALRETLSRRPELLIVGATSRALEVGFRYDKSFYDFFRVHELTGLDEAETFELMRELAKVTDKPEVLRVVEREPARVLTLRLLSGGNPRTLVLLFNMLSQGVEGDVRSDLERLLDQVTPLYKHRFEELAPQAQRVVDALALSWDPIAAGPLAQRLRLEVNKTSAQLNRLVRAGVVEKVKLPNTKRAGFQISERFFNIWYLMRASRRLRHRLVLLVKFLGLFFPPEHLSARGRRYLRGPESSERADYGFALALTVEEPGLRRALETHSLRSMLQDPSLELGSLLDLDGEDKALRSRVERLEMLAEAKRLILAAQWEWPKGVDAESFWRVWGGVPFFSAEEKLLVARKLQSAAEEAPILPRLISELWDACAQANALDDESTMRIVSAGYREGYVDRRFDLADALSLSEKYGAPEVIPVLVALAMHGPLDEGDQAELFEVLDENVHLSRSHYIHTTWANWSQALNVKERVDALAEVDLELATPWSLRVHAEWLRRVQQPERAEAMLRRAINLSPESERVWVELGSLLYQSFGRREEAEFAFRHAIELDAESADAWWWLGTLLSDVNESSSQAEFAYRQALSLAPEESGILNDFAWFLLKSRGDLECAESLAQLAVSLEPSSPHENHTLAVIQARRGAWPSSDALRFLSSGDERFFESGWEEILQLFAELTKHGYASRARDLLESLDDLAVRWTPLIAALDIAARGDIEALLGYSPEMRQTVELTLERIAPHLLSTDA